jgi:hypothetical protein
MAHFARRVPRRANELSGAALVQAFRVMSGLINEFSRG